MLCFIQNKQVISEYSREGKYKKKGHEKGESAQGVVDAQVGQHNFTQVLQLNKQNSVMKSERTLSTGLLKTFSMFGLNNSCSHIIFVTKVKKHCLMIL